LLLFPKGFATSNKCKKIMENHKYSLAKKGKTKCPECGQKTFVLYIDNDTGNPVHETVGRCDRENNCAYHCTPKQYFADNNISFDKLPTTQTYNQNSNATIKPQQSMPYVRNKSLTTEPQPVTSYIDTDMFKQSLQGYGSNNFVKYLHKLVGAEVATKAIEGYSIGTSKNGGTVFWQIDLQGKIRTGKIIQYDESGHRRKNVMPPVQWVHSLLKLPSYNLSQCLFGEYLLHDTTKKVAIVESEKTAIIANIYLPDMIWLATGGSNGINIDKCRCLKGRTVVLYPDAGCFDKWTEKAKELSIICNVVVSPLIENKATDEQRKAGYDLADYLVKTPFTAQIKAQQQPVTQTSPPIIESPTAHETRQDKRLNDEVLRIKKETVNFTNEIEEIADFFSTITLMYALLKPHQNILII